MGVVGSRTCRFAGISGVGEGDRFLWRVGSFLPADAPRIFVGTAFCAEGDDVFVDDAFFFAALGMVGGADFFAEDAELFREAVCFRGGGADVFVEDANCFAAVGAGGGSDVFVEDADCFAGADFFAVAEDFFAVAADFFAGARRGISKLNCQRLSDFGTDRIGKDVSGGVASGT
jgi:hypothetical protein